MSRKHKHEDHVNHEAWAIPYGDLVTLLLALFVVMYAISSVNEGKYRAVSASLSAAFNGVPRTPIPVQVGEVPVQSQGASPDVAIMPPPTPPESEALNTPDDAQGTGNVALEQISEQLSEALRDLIEADVIVVRDTPFALEIEIQTDLLFPSGTADLSSQARAILGRLGNELKQFANPVKVEGHTDNLPIRTAEFPSNWELSSARAATVVHLLMQAGVAPRRMTVVGLAEYHPKADNATEAGRNRNRRVQLIIPGKRADGPAPVRQSVPADDLKSTQGIRDDDPNASQPAPVSRSR